MKIFEASRNLAKLTAQFKAAGLNVDDFINAEDETALKAHIDSLAPQAGAVEAALAKAKTAQDEAAKHLAIATAYTQGLTAAGIALKPADEAKGLQASDVTAAISGHVSLKGAELAAQQGKVPAVAAEVKPSAPAAAAPKANENLHGRERYTADFNAQIKRLRSRN